MNRTLFVVLASLVLVSGCTFRRRPPPDGAGSSAGGPVTAATDSARSADRIAGARAFLRAFQGLRRDGSMDRARASLSAEAVLLRGSRPLAGAPDSTDEDELLTPPNGERGAAAVLQTVTTAGSAVVFVLRYPPAEDARDNAVETIVVAPDPSAPLGWTVGLLQRTLETER